MQWSRRMRQLMLVPVVLLVAGTLGASSAQTPAVAVQSYPGEIRFQVRQAGVEQVHVEIFNLAGIPIYRSEWAPGSALSWPLVTDQGERVANGVFLYVVEAKDTQGAAQQWVGKLAVLEGRLQGSQAPRSAEATPALDDPSRGSQVRSAQAEAEFTGIISHQQSGVFPAALFQTDSLTGDVSFEWGLSPANFNDTWGLKALSIGAPSNAGDFLIQRKASGTWQPIDLRIDFDNGNMAVGPGISNPAARFVVASDSGTNLIEAYDTSVSPANLRFRVERTTGDVFADGNFNSGGADVAERIDVTEPVEAGDVMEIDPQHPGQFRKAQGELSRRVAGVISTAPGVVLGNRSVAAEGARRDTRPILALAGRVPVKAIAKYGAIEVGDLLVSSPIPGYAMVCPESSQCVGAVIGKALEPLQEGVGKIMIQVMLR